MNSTLRLLLLLEAVSFILAGVVHRGLIVSGYAHAQASIAETIIGLVLLAGLGLTFVWPARTRLIALGAQVFALLGTLVGAFTIAIGVGPRTAPDVAYHVAILVVLGLGVLLAARSNDRLPAERLA